MKKMLFVFNPNSGKAQIKNVLLYILQTFSDAGYDVTVYPTKATLDGFNYIKSVEGVFDVIVCSGGDGTFNETIAAVMSYTKKTPIGYIPSGTTNDFAVSLSIPRDMRKAAQHIANGVPRKCDVGLFNGRSFNYVAAFGAFTDVSYQTPQNMKNVLGHQAYILEAMKRLAFLKTYKMKFTYEDGVISDEFMYGMISNAKSIGGMKGLVGKSVKLNDGVFEVTLIKKPKNPLEFQQFLSGFLTQSIEDKDMVYTFKTSKLQIESETNVSWTLDGEYGGDLNRIDFNVAKEAIELILKKNN